MKSKRKSGIVTLGINGLPLLKSAPVNKALFINKALKDAGFEVLILNDEAILRHEGGVDSLSGNFMDINYEYTTSSIYISNDLFTRKLNLFYAKIKKWIRLINLKKKGYNKILFFTDGSFIKLVSLFLFSKIFNYKVFLVYHELRSEFLPRKSKIKYRVNDYLFDKWCYKFVDAIFPISEYLINRLNSLGNRKPMLKIPPLCDLEEYPKEEIVLEPNFVFCGSMGRKDIIEFVIAAFEKLSQDCIVNLVLIVFGSDLERKKLLERIQLSPKSNYIKVFSELEFKELLRYYSSSIALLIPLRNDLRDIARFPQKISEYALSGRPLISTNVGEIGHYFKDNVNAFIVDEFDVDLFSMKMNHVIRDKEHALNVGVAGKITAVKYFDFRSYSKPLHKFINQHNF